MANAAPLIHLQLFEHSLLPYSLNNRAAEQPVYVPTPTSLFLNLSASEESIKTIAVVVI
jgi:hypothetical protein